MNKINFQNLPNTTTPVSAENLNAIQNNAETAINAVETGANTNLANATKGYQTTQEAEAHELTDSAGVKGKIDVTNGKTEQDTRSGKNLLNIYDLYQIGYTTTKNGVTFTILEKGGIKINGTPTANTSIPILGVYQSGVTKINFNGDYVQSGVSDTISILYFNNTSQIANLFEGNTANINSTCDYAILTTRINVVYDNVIIYPQLEQGTTPSEYEEYGASPTPNYPSDIRNVGDNVNYFDGELELGNFDNQGNPTTDTRCIRSKNYQLVKGSTNYYILSSNSDYHIVLYMYDDNKTFIASVGGSVTKIQYFTTTANTKYIKFRTAAGYSENDLTVKFKLSSENIETPYTPYNAGSINIKTESKNKFAGWTRNIATNPSNGARTSNDNYLSSDYCEIKPNTQYIISGVAIATYSKNKYVSFYDINKTYISRTSSTNFSYLQFMTPVNAYYCVFAVNGAFADAQTMENFINDCSEIQLEQRAQKTSYQEYGKQEITFPFVNGQRLHEGDYLAEDGIHQNRITMVLDGTETFSNRTVLTNTTRVGIAVSQTAKSNGEQKCTHFENIVNYTQDVPHFYVATTLWLFVPIDIGSGENQIKQWLAAQYSAGTPVTVEYELAEEIVIPYTAEQQEAYYQLQHAQMYEGYTEIECIDEMKPETKVSYLYNNDINNTFGSIIDKLEERVHDLENS